MNNTNDNTAFELNRVATGRTPLGGRGAGRAKKVTTWFAPLAHDRISRAAANVGLTRSEIVRNACAHYIDSMSPTAMSDLVAELTPIADAIYGGNHSSFVDDEDDDLIDEDPAEAA